MPDAVKADDEQTQAEWIFMQAACWPDTTRRLEGEENKKYDHATWHYINRIAYLNPSDKEAIGPIDLNLETEPPREQSEEMNAIQAIKFAMLRIDGTIKVSPQQDALLLCWLLHSYSDLHQPLHTTAMFSKTLLPDGCRGGNRIKTKQSRNLHSLWDGLLGNDASYQACHNQAVGMMTTSDLLLIGETALVVSDAESVLKGSHAHCVSVAYDDEVRAHLQRLEADGETELAPIDLSEGYLKRAGRVARIKAVQAGWRLGELLK